MLNLEAEGLQQQKTTPGPNHKVRIQFAQAYQACVPDGYFQQDNATCHKGRIMKHWLPENESTGSLYSSESTVNKSRASSGCGETGDLNHGCAAGKSATTT
ncbi:hypothetical protein ILYODFUR_032983 [Ilyodon furcidens]|uniref:Uncharacterized protein n=1 Tax=Ilyodon furcidens TaxID=33524 RepID=A0ABV0TD17_9TELE